METCNQLLPESNFELLQILCSSECACHSLLRRVKWSTSDEKSGYFFVHVKMFLLEPLIGKSICDYGLYLEILMDMIQLYLP